MIRLTGIERVVKSVQVTFENRGWKTSRSRSRKSQSQYITAIKKNRKIIVRVSDHKASPSCRCDLDYDPKTYQQRRLASLLDRKRSRFRLMINRRT